MDSAATLRRLEEEARASIRAAFASTDVPAARDVLTDHCPECRETAERFVGKRWEEVTASDLRHPGLPAVGLMTPRAFAYYLPALMLGCIDSPRELDVLPDAVIGSLSPARGDAAERLRAFDPGQAAAILSFLRVFELRERRERAECEEAVEWTTVPRPLSRAIRYWAERP